jgi:hypothetical protein
MDKFSVRDFFVYFLTGVIGIITFAPLFADKTLTYLNSPPQWFKDYTIVFSFLSILILYYVGHLFQAIEDIFFFFSRVIHKRFRNQAFLRPIIAVCNSHRVQAALEAFNVKSDTFWKKCHRLQSRNYYTTLDYWYIMSDFFKSVFLLTAIALIASLIEGKFVLSSIYLFLSFITWYRTRVFSFRFVKEILLSEE